MTTSEAKITFQTYFSGIENIGLVIQKLKTAGATQMVCTRTLMLELKIPLSEADKIVRESNAWVENLGKLNKFRNNIFDKFEEKQNEKEA